MVYDYIKEKDLQTKEDRRVIKPDAHLNKLFHLKDSDTLEFKNFQTFMARLYKRNFDEDDEYVSTSASESETEKVTPVKKSKGKNKKSKSATSSI